MKIKKEPQCSSGQGRRRTKTIIIHSAFTLIDNITNFDKNGLLMGVCKIYAVSQKLQHFTFNQDFPRSTIIYCLKSSNGTVPVCWMGGCSERRPARPQTKVFSELACVAGVRKGRGRGRELERETKSERGGRRGTPARKPLFSPSCLLIKK